jgi:hypothetical protein
MVEQWIKKILSLLVFREPVAGLSPPTPGFHLKPDFVGFADN